MQFGPGKKKLPASNGSDVATGEIQQVKTTLYGNDFGPT